MRKRDEKRSSSSAEIKGESPPQKRSDFEVGPMQTTPLSEVPAFPIAGSVLERMFETQGDAEIEAKSAEERNRGTSQSSSSIEVDSVQLAQMLVGMKTTIEAQQAQILSMQQQNAAAAQHLGDSNQVIQKLTELLQGNIKATHRPDEEPKRTTSGDQNMMDIGIQEALQEADKEKRLSSYVKARLNKAGAQLKKGLLGLNRSKAHLEKLDSQITELRQGTIPKGCKPFALPFASTAWEQPSGELSDIIEGVLPDDSLEEARKKIHIGSLVAAAEIDRKVEAQRQKLLQRETSFEAFVAIYEKHANEEREAIEEFAQRLDRVPEELFAPMMTLARKEAIKTYRRLIESSALEAAKYKEERERKTKLQQEALDRAAQLPAQEVLKHAFTRHLLEQGFPKGKSKGKGKGRQNGYDPTINYPEMVKLELQEPTTYEGNPKNGVSPGEAQGHNPKPKGKGKGKGKSKDKSKARGKSNAKSPSKGKGKNTKPKQKGKGKGKGQNPQATSAWYNGNEKKGKGKGAQTKGKAKTKHKGKSKAGKKGKSRGKSHGGG